MLAELMRMAVRLGLETVTEGVETKEQVDFLCEVGCTRMQGYFFCKPVSQEDIKKRYKEGKQIGFENPEEMQYHAVMSSVNLYDIGTTVNEEAGSSKLYFDSQPVLMVELDDKEVRFVRCNGSYSQFAEIYSLLGNHGDAVKESDIKGRLNRAFYKALHECEEIGQKVFVNELADNGDTVHAFITKVAFNPLKKTSSYALAVVGVTPKSDKGLTFTGVAKALSVDYIDIYQVDLDTEAFTEYSPDKENGDISIERRGEDFFATSRKDALTYIHEDDRDGFINAFTKENVVNSLDEYGVFNYTYRANFYGDTIYVNMKALRMAGEGNEIIIGVNNVDAQMRERETLERLKEETATYSRISVLMGDFIAIYTIDPETGAYMEYSASHEYSELGTSKAGLDFFRDSYNESVDKIHPEDYDNFFKEFTMENVIAKTQNGKVFNIRYRLKMGDEYVKINLRAGQVKEKDGMQLIVGLSMA